MINPNAKTRWIPLIRAMANLEERVRRTPWGQSVANLEERVRRTPWGQSVANPKAKIRTIPLTQSLNLHYLNTDRFVGGEILRMGEYEPFETGLLLDHVEEGDIVVDIGANIGIYTLLLAQKVGATGKVYAFEPDPTNFALLTKNSKENNLTNVISSDVALSDKKAQASLFLSKDNFGDHQLYADGTGRESISVPMDTLDNLLKNVYKEKKPIKVVKIDTQGCEPFVINGAKEIIRENHPVLFLEYWPYGYRRSGADYNAMIAFLVEFYGQMHFIDEINKKMFTVDQDFIDEYCQGMNGQLYCNIVFF